MLSEKLAEFSVRTHVTLQDAVIGPELLVIKFQVFVFCDPNLS
jgi:hypothetical protein